MADKAYISTIPPGWPVERQEAILAECVPGWPVRVYRDLPDARSRKAHDVTLLGDRKSMLRATTRRSNDTIYVATLAVLAWTKADFLAVLAAAKARGDTIQPADTGAALGADADPSAAVAAFMASKVEGVRRVAQLSGGRVSADKRKAEKAPGIEKIKDRWGWPNTDKMAAKWGFPDHPFVSTKDLMTEAGATYNTIASHIGHGRETAQRYYLATLKRKATMKEKAR